jgi:hypothetical protein
LTLKLFAVIVAILLIGGILLIGNAFLGNPISASTADRAIEKYVENHYPLLDLKVEKAHYNLKIGEYMAMAQSGKSIDTKFAIYTRGDQIIRDNYQNYVLSGFNTRLRLSQEYSSLVKTLISTEPGLSNNTSIVWYFEEPSDVFKLDMKFDKSLPIKVKVTVRYDLTDKSTEGIARILTDVHKVFVSNNCNFAEYGLFAENDEGYVMVNGVTANEIESGELPDLLEKAKNGDLLNGIRFVVKSYNR